MSDTVLKLIPTDLRHIPPAETHQKALDLLVELTQGWEPEAKIYDRLEYVDPGEYIEAILCPRCGKQLAMDWTAEHEVFFRW